MTDEAPGGADWVRWSVSRRTVLKGLGIGAAVTYAELELPGLVRAAYGAGAVPRLTIDVVRPDDLLRLTFRLTNLVLDTSIANQPRLVRGGANVTPLIAVDLGPQHVAEQVLLTAGGQSNNQDLNQPPPSPPQPPQDGLAEGLPAVAQSRLAHSSRLVFALPGNVQSIPFTLAGLLDWNSLVPVVVPVAAPLPQIFKTPKLRKPNANETAIEAPWWLVLSPGAQQAWAHATGTVTHGGRTELWHSRLASRAGNAVDEAHPDPIRAVWAGDPNFTTLLANRNLAPDFTNQIANPYQAVDGMPMRMTFTPRDRVDVVRNTSDFSKANPQLIVRYSPKPFDTKRLMVSALGAYLDLDGEWADTPFNSLIGWRHRATLGRDHYVRIVNRGYIFPFGHRAVLVRESDRKFLYDQFNQIPRGAYLTIRFFIIVTQPVRDYPPNSLGLQFAGRGSPFTRLEVMTRVTQTFDGMTKIGQGNTFAFQPTAQGTPIPLTFRGTDHEGKDATFTAPFVFVEDVNGAPFDENNLKDVAVAYNNDNVVTPAQKSANLNGQRVAFAPPRANEAGNTAFPVQQLVFGALEGAANAAQSAYKALDQLAAYPAMAQSVIRLPDVEKLAGVPGLTTPVQFPLEYLTDGFGGPNSLNAGEAFLKMAQQVPLPFGGENAGGVVNPKQLLSAITRPQGPVAGQLADIVNDTFKPDQVFNDITAKILGGIPLKEILGAVNGMAQDAKAAEQAIRQFKDQLPTEVVIRFKWKPKLIQDPLHIFEPRLNSDPKTEAFIEGEARQSTTDPNNHSYRFHGELTNFTLHLIGDGAGEFLRLDISKLQFTSASGQKSTVDVTVDQVTFQGALKFVDQLRQYLPIVGNALESIPIPQAVTASMGIAIPAVAVGIFELSNLSFTARVTIPLNGDPVRVRFAFSSRQDPFTLTISCFGGGGFVALAIGADGVEQLEIQFDFCGSFTIDIGIAQGGVDVRAGTYLKLAKSQNQQNPNGLDLVIEGYVKLHGAVNVLGIVSVVIDVYVSLQYVHKDGPPTKDIASGRAKVTLKVSILFFSVTLSADVALSYGGDPKDPSFAQSLTSNDWADYAAAFAAV